MKKNISLIIGIVVLALVILAVVLGTVSSNNKKNYSLDEIYNQLTSSDMLPNMSSNVSEENLELKYGIDFTNITNYMYTRATESPKQDTIAIFEVANATEIENLKTTLKNIQTQCMNSMQNYEPTQYEIATNGQITSKGNYVVFVMTQKVDEVVTKIMSML